MFVPYIFVLLFFMSFTHCFILNSFRYLTQEITSSVLRTGTNTSSYETRWLEQKLDHFDQREHRTWKMRYFTRLDLWKENGPIYIFIGGEAEASPGFLESGMAYELAKETNGALYATEHRYYGKSIPVNGTEARDFKYLSARQALADIVHLIRTVKSNSILRGAKVVVIGGSYPGNLATWLRQLHPDLVDAAIASSAPVLAKKDFYGYLEKVSEDFKRYGTEGCWSSIKDSFKNYEIMFTSREGIEKLKKQENICPETDMSNLENRQFFFFMKVGTFMDIAQKGDTTQIKIECRNVNTKKMSLQYNEFGFWVNQNQCNNIDFNAIMDYYYKYKMNDQVGWLYQICTEFGYFQSTSSDMQPFTHNIPVDFFVKMCTRVFGPQFTESRVDRGVDNVNKMYGGLKPKVTNVVFVNGDLDPWSRLGILEDLSVNAPAIVIPRVSHCRDLFSNRDGDEQELNAARRKIKNYIKKWIGFQK